MAYVPVSNSYLQLTLRSILFDQVVMNTFHWRYEAGGAPITDGAATIDAFHALLDAAGYFDAYKACVPPQVTFISADWQWIFPTRYVKRTIAVALAGTYATGTTTTNMAVAMELRGDTASRRSTGTKHIPGLGGAAVTAGEVIGGLQTLVSNFANFNVGVQTMAGNQYRSVIYGRARPSYTDKHGVVHPALPTIGTPVTSTAVQSSARVMRRRTVRVGI